MWEPKKAKVNRGVIYGNDKGKGKEPIGKGKREEQF